MELGSTNLNLNYNLYPVRQGTFKQQIILIHNIIPLTINENQTYFVFIRNPGDDDILEMGEKLPVLRDLIVEAWLDNKEQRVCSKFDLTLF